MPGFNIATDKAINCPANDSNLTNTPIYQGPSYTEETARSYRYKLEVLEPLGTTTGNGILLFLEKCTRPTPEVDEIVIHSGQDEIIRPGKNRWSPIEFTFYEKLSGAASEDGGSPIDSVAEKIYEWWGSSMIDLKTSSHRPVTDYYKRAELSMKDGYGNDVWTYYLYDCWPVKVTPGNLDYADSQIARITVTLRYNKAQEQKNSHSNTI